MNEHTPEQSQLGKASVYVDQYDPGLLFPIPRAPKRQEIGIEGAPRFLGADFWTAYELSWLNLRGKPQVGMATLMVPADTPNIVESKSMKLYFNSLNQTRVGSATELADLLRTDLSAGFGASVQLKLVSPEDFGKLAMGEFDGLLALAVGEAGGDGEDAEGFLL